MVKSKRMKAWLLVIALVIVSVFRMEDMTVSAAGADVKLAKKSVFLMIQKSKSGSKYGTAKVKVKMGKGITVKKVSCKVKMKGIVTVAAKGKTAPTLTVKAKKQGSTQVAVSVRYKKAGKIKTKKLTLKVKVELKNEGNDVKNTSKPIETFTPTTETPTPVNEKEAGLYDNQTDKMVMTWSELLNNGFSVSADGVFVMDDYLDVLNDLTYTSEKTYTLILSNQISSIGSYAFSPIYHAEEGGGRNPQLTKVIIPNSVTEIQDHAFFMNDNLEYIDIPDSVKMIEDEAFFDCLRLKSIYLPDGIANISYGMFLGCEKLTSIKIPNSVVSIGSRAFGHCRSLTSITIPYSVTEIGYNEFEGCRSLINIEVDANNFVYDSRNGCNAIIETKTNELIAGCQKTVILDSVTSIGKYAFWGCEGLASMTIPDSVTSIGDSAFSGCSDLTNIAIPNSVTRIEEFAFSGCSSLTSITIPDSVTSIGECAFREVKKVIYNGTATGAPWGADSVTRQ